MNKTSYVALLFCCLLNGASLFAQQESVRPGINASFNNATDEALASFVERFEKEGREVYDQRQEIVAACQLRPAMSIADIGAGTGLFTGLMAPSVAELFAVDISQKFLDHVAENSKKNGNANVRTVLCDQTSCNLKPDSIDVAFICDTYHHFEFPYRTMRSIRNALKPNGIVVLVEFDRTEGKSSEWILKHVRADRATFTREIELAGFEEIELIDDIFETSYLKRFKISDRRTEEGHTIDSLADVKQGVADVSAVLIDVRELTEWDAAHLKDARSIPLSELKKFAAKKKATAKNLPMDKIIYVHSKSGSRALMAADALKQHGFDIRPLAQEFDVLVKEGFEQAK